MNPTTPSKQAYCNALRAFISQRSGIDFHNYGDRKSFMTDYRRVLRDGKQARELLAFVEGRDAITAEMIEEASRRAFMGRLSFEVDGKYVYVSYIVGQYWVTEYRAAACAVLASAIWAHLRNNMTAGDAIAGEIRKQARELFGRGMAKDWFN